MRFFAASMVVIHHFGLSSWPFDSPERFPIVHQGGWVVSFFFFLSGTVLTLGQQGERIGNWKAVVLKRFGRIYPLYWIALLPTILMMMWLYHAYPKGIRVIAHTFLLQAWFPGISLEMNYPSWTLAVEIFFYAVFPFVFNFFRKLSLLRSFMLVLAIWVFSFWVQLKMSAGNWLIEGINMDHLLLYFPLQHLNTFLWGIFGGKIIQYTADISWINRSKKWLLLVSAVGLYFLLQHFEWLRVHGHNGLLSPFFALILIGGTTQDRFWNGLLANRLMLFLGQISYTFYLFQFLVFMVFIKIVGRDDVHGGAFMVYFLVLVIFSALVHQYVDQPIQRRLRSRIKKG